MKKTIFKRFITGLKVGWNTPMLPESVTKIHNHPFTRVFRVIGGALTVLVLSKNYLILPFSLQLIVLALASFHIIYITCISLIKLFYGFKVLRSDKLNVRNSPMDQFASVTSKLLFCWKYGCQVGSAGLGLVGTSFLLDSILEAGNQEKVFTPLIGKGVRLIVNGKPADSVFIDIQKDMNKVNSVKKRLEDIDNLFENAKTMEDCKHFTKKDIESIRSGIAEMKSKEESNLQSEAKALAKKIKDYSKTN